MKKNLSRLDAGFRILVGFILFYLFVLGGPLWTGIGLYLMLSGSFGFCLFYHFLKLKNR